MQTELYPGKLTRAARRLAELLEENGKPVLTQFDFFRIIWRMYRESAGKRLYLRHDTPRRDDYDRLKSILQKARVVGRDRDYRARGIRVLSISDLPAEDIICLVDPTCYLSHLSAMQRWGLTDRSPKALLLTRPDRKTATARILAYRKEALGEDEARANPFLSKTVRHPPRVRRRDVHVYESKAAGAFLKNRGVRSVFPRSDRPSSTCFKGPIFAGACLTFSMPGKNTRKSISTRLLQQSTLPQAGWPKAEPVTFSKNALACIIAALSTGRHSLGAAAAASLIRPKTSHRPFQKNG